MKIGAVFLNFPTIPSTNQFASQLIAKTRPRHGTVISADYQTAGKGQFGRQWLSDPNSGVAVSIILRPTLVPAEQFSISICAAMAVAETVEVFCSGEVQVKWPNDIYIGDGKVAGVLIQNSIASQSIVHSIVGIGINVNNMSFPEQLPNPASIILDTGQFNKVREVRDVLIEKFNRWHERLYTERREHLADYFLSRMYRAGKKTDFVLAGSSDTIAATIIGIDQTGRLLVEREGEQKAYRHDEIQMKL